MGHDPIPRASQADPAPERLAAFISYGLNYLRSDVLMTDLRTASSPPHPQPSICRFSRGSTARRHRRLHFVHGGLRRVSERRTVLQVGNVGRRTVAVPQAQPQEHLLVHDYPTHWQCSRFQSRLGPRRRGFEILAERFAVRSNIKSIESKRAVTRGDNAHRACEMSHQLVDSEHCLGFHRSVHGEQ